MFRVVKFQLLPNGGLGVLHGGDKARRRGWDREESRSHFLQMTNIILPHNELRKMFIAH